MSSQPRVQFVISSRFIMLLLVGFGLLITGYFLFQRKQQSSIPLFYTNRISTVLKPCRNCTIGPKLKEPGKWTFGEPLEIPAGEQWWFSPVENPPETVIIDGVPMLPVHPAYKNNPQFGFDLRRVYFVVAQDLDGKFALQRPEPPPVVPTPTPVTQAEAPTPLPAVSVAEVIPPEESSVSIIDPTHWKVTLAKSSEWFCTRIPVAPLMRVSITGVSKGAWTARIGTKVFSDCQTVQDGGCSLTIGVPAYAYYLPLQGSADLYVSMEQPSDLLSLEAGITLLDVPESHPNVFNLKQAHALVQAEIASRWRSN